MASGRIKGITIEIDGDPSGFTNSLKQIDSSLRGTQAQLRDLDKLLKLDPTNTELLRQKQQDLKNAISETKDRLDTLKKAYQELKNGDQTPESIKQQEALAREIAETENKLKSLKQQFREFGSVAKQELQAIGDTLKDVGEKMQNVGKNLTAKLTAPILAIGGIGVSYNAQMEQYQTMFTTLTGSAEEADRAIQNILTDASNSPFDVSSLVQANQYLISAGIGADEARKTINDLGNAIAATGGGSDELNRMAANLQQIQNVGKATSVDIKQFANAGINIYGLLSEATGKSVEEVKEMDVSYELLAEALAMASEEGGKYAGAMEAQSQTLNGALNKTKQSAQRLLGSMTKAAMPIIVKVLEKIQDFINWLNSLDDKTKQTILVIAAVVAAIGPVILVIGKIVSGIGSVISIIGALFSPLGAVVVAFAAVVAAGVLLYKNWDTIKQKAQELKQKVVNAITELKNGIIRDFTAAKDKAVAAFEQLKSGVASKIESMKNTIKNAMDKVVQFIKDPIGSAYTWGRDLVSNLASGMDHAQPILKGAVYRVADLINKDLAFSEPEEGPLSNFHTYMPDMLKLMAQGINDNSYLVEDAINNLASNMANGVQNSVNYGGVTINMTVPNGANGTQLVDQIETEIANRTIRRRAVFA